MTEHTQTITTIDEAMRGFTNGNLDLLKDETPETIYEQYRELGGQEPFFTIEELSRWMEANV